MQGEIGLLLGSLENWKNDDPNGRDEMDGGAEGPRDLWVRLHQPAEAGTAGVAPQSYRTKAGKRNSLWG